MYPVRGVSVPGVSARPSGAIALAAESSADELYSFEHSLVPGLLQTEAYAREILSTWPNVTPDEVDRLVRARIARQDVIRRTDRKPPYLWALIDEGVLHRPVAPAAVLREQFSYLVEVSHLPNVGTRGTCLQGWLRKHDGQPR